jgi:hypothetical protein
VFSGRFGNTRVEFQSLPFAIRQQTKTQIARKRGTQQTRFQQLKKATKKYEKWDGSEKEGPQVL